MSNTLLFTMTKAMDSQMPLIGTVGSSPNRRVIDLSSYGLTKSSADIHIASTLTTSGLDTDKVWIQQELVKVPSKRFNKCLTHQKGLYTIFIKTLENDGKYFNEALSDAIENHFQYNQKISQDGELITILDSFQQPNVFLHKETQRYWNRVFINCEVYHTL